MTRIRRAEQSRRGRLDEVEFLAWLLDNSIPLPGTGRRIGIDAIIGLVPGLGDVISGGLGLWVVFRGTQLGLPRVVVARMFANLALDFAIGSIPFVGDVFDLWFKANARNLGLMRRYLDWPRESTAGQWLFFVGVLAVAVAAAALALWLVAWIIGLLVSLV